MYNILLVDDEPVIRKGILCFVNWEYLGCEVSCEAENAAQAMEYLHSEKIDIVITDIKMPGMDGIELSKFIYENYPDIKIIILTAFPDFSYAQSAIKYGIVDFVIKTNPSEKIPEAIVKAKAMIEQQRKKETLLKNLENIVSTSLSEKTEMFFKDTVHGIIINHSEIEAKTNELKINLKRFCIVVYEINNMPEQNVKVNPEEQNKFLFSVKNFLELALKKYTHYTYIMNDNLLFSVISFDNDNISYCTQSLIITCNEMLSMLDNFVKFTISIGISTIHVPASEIRQAYNEAVKALSINFYNSASNNVYVYLPSNDSQMISKQNDIYKSNDTIIRFVQSCDFEPAVSCLKELFKMYKSNQEPIEQVKISCMLLCSMCFRLLANYQFNQPDTEDESCEIATYKKIQQTKSIIYLYDLLTSTVKHIIDLIKSNNIPSNYYVRKAMEYVRENYKKNINLHSISEHIHVNSNYMSRLYKKETGESIIDTLNKLRIERAKILLREPSNRVFEVAALVGIDDPAYFTHVFIKYTGITPKEYKESFYSG